jgi:hypothetical protein
MFLLIWHPISTADTLHTEVSSREQNYPNNIRALLAPRVKKVKLSL